MFTSSRTTPCGRKPMLCWKRDRKPWLAFVPTKELEGHPFSYRLVYKQWSAVALDELLKLPDDVFLWNETSSDATRLGWGDVEKQPEDTPHEHSEQVPRMRV